MSMLEGGVSCDVTLDIENNGTVNPDSVQTVQNTNAPSSHVEDTDDDGELLKGLLTDTFCQVCEAVLLYESQRVSHYEGKKHAQKVRIYLQTKKAERIRQSDAVSSFQSGNVNPEKFCELCNMVFSSPVVAKSHYEGKVHAKKIRKNNTTPADIKPTAVPVAVSMPAWEGATEGKADQEQKESADSLTQEVNLNDKERYCKLCTASFNNPVMAQQHYSGRKHQRNQSRQKMLDKLSTESDNANSLTCPVCCVTLSSVETYQAHMQSNKHFVKEKKIAGLCKSQKKVYDSFQDELADYIQVQKARGLELKTGPGSEAHGNAEEGLNESESCEEEPDMPPPSSHLPPPPFPARPSFRPSHRRPPFQPRTGHFGFRGRFPMQPLQHQWGQGYPPHPPPLIPGLTGRSFRRGRSPDSFSSSSSSSSDSRSYSSSTSRSSSSDSSSDSGSDRRRQRRKRKEKMQRRREQDSDSDKDKRRRSSKRRRRREGEEEEGHPKKAKRERRMSFEEELGTGEEKERRKRKEKRHREGDSGEEDEHRTKRRVSKKNRREKEGDYEKRRSEEDEGERSKESEKDMVQEGVQIERVQATALEPTEDRTELRGEEKSKRKKEKKKAREKTGEGDNRTEEEKLWDETILGIF